MQIPDGSAFCPGCGNKVEAAPVAPVVPVAPVEPVAPVVPVAVAPVEPVAPVAPAAPVEPVAPVAPVAVAPVAAPVAPVYPVAPVPQQPKKKNTGLIIAIVAVVVLIATAAVLYFTGVFDDLFGGNDKKKDKEKDEPSTSQTDPSGDPTNNGIEVLPSGMTTEQVYPKPTYTSTYPTYGETEPTYIPTSPTFVPTPGGDYTDGYFDDGYYINEWANLALELDDDCVDAGSGVAISSTVYRALWVVSEADGIEAQIQFENLQGQNISAEQYMLIVEDSLKAVMTSQGGTYTRAGFDSSAEVGGHNGTALALTLTSSQGQTRYSGIFCYENDGYMVCVLVNSDHENGVGAVMNCLQAVN